MDDEKASLRELLEKDPADIAEVLGSLSDEQAADFVHRLFLRGEASRTLAEMSPEESADLVRRLDRQEASRILAGMDPDDAVDVLTELPDDVRRELLSRLSRQHADVLADLLTYPPNSAGGLMTPQVVALSLSMTAEEALDTLRRREAGAETVHYAYAVDDAHRLQGVLSLRDMALAPPKRPLSELVIRDAVTVTPDADAETVARLFDKYDFFALPVVDDHRRLLGVITVDDVLDVIRDEATADIYGLASVPSAEGVDTTWWDSLRLRLPWLGAKLAAGLAAAAVAAAFEATIERLAALAVMMVAIAGQGTASGMQTATIITRGMALGEIDRRTSVRLLVKEILLGAAHGAVLGVVAGLLAWAWKRDVHFGAVIAAAMLASLVVGALAGVAIPLLVRALGRDPATLSRLLLTALTEAASLGLLFLLAHLLLPALQG
ncbi:MAG: magnesium transporter [Candidatus Bipolaricaulota bacterium]